MAGETAQQTGRSDQVQRRENQDPLQVFGSVFRQQLDQAIEPLVANIRRQQPVTPENAGELMPAPLTARRRGTRRKSAGRASSKKRSSQHVLSLTVDRPQAESALHAVLDAVLGALFSDDLQTACRASAEHAVQSLVKAAHELAADGPALSVKPEQFDGKIDELVKESFSDSLRENAFGNGEQVISELLAWDMPAAKQTGTKLLAELSVQRFTAAETFWQDVLMALWEAGRRAEQPPDSKSSNGAETSDPKSPPADDLPQTLLRSDRRAQEIWVKARDKAAGKDGNGTGAERAAYTALKQRYEKKGDRWVKKTGEQANSET